MVDSGDCLQVIAREVRTDSNLSSTAIVTIYLEDANDNKPQFNVDSYSIPALSELTNSQELIDTLPLVRFCDRLTRPLWKYH